MPPPAVRIVPDLASLHRAAADEFARRAEEAVRSRGAFNVVLSGGSTPQGLYTLLAEDPSHRRRILWEKVHFWFTDERHVPADHSDNNYRMAYRALLSKIPAPPWNAHRFPTEAPDAGFAAGYMEQWLRMVFRLRHGEAPRMDLVFLGMGADGHVASLFPGSAAVRETEHLAAAVWVESLKAHRVTLTPPVFNAAACVIFLVSGSEKAEALRDALEADQRPDLHPAQAVRPASGDLIWIVDRAAASLLKGRA